MAFMLYSILYENDKNYLVNIKKSFQLAGNAGNGVIYNSWKKQNKPLNTGWHIDENQLLAEINPAYNINNSKAVIDFHPSSKKRIGIIAVTDIYLFTYGNPDGQATWSPMMLKIRDIFYSEYPQEFTKDFKEKKISKLEHKSDSDVTVEFLYINGDNYGWNWGRNGMTNAAFIKPEARDFFRQYF